MSADVGCGLQHNWISYSLLQIMLCVLTGYTPGVLTYFVNDLHIYNNHLDLLNNMERKSYSSPQLEVDDTVKSIYDFNMDSFKLINYKSGPLIKLPLAI
jgi:thymidylate synthase